MRLKKGVEPGINTRIGTVIVKCRKTQQRATKNHYESPPGMTEGGGTDGTDQEGRPLRKKGEKKRVCDEPVPPGTAEGAKLLWADEKKAMGIQRLQEAKRPPHGHDTSEWALAE